MGAGRRGTVGCAPNPRVLFFLSGNSYGFLRRISNGGASACSATKSSEVPWAPCSIPARGPGPGRVFKTMISRVGGPASIQTQLPMLLQIKSFIKSRATPSKKDAPIQHLTPHERRPHRARQNWMRRPVRARESRCSASVVTPRVDGERALADDANLARSCGCDAGRVGQRLPRGRESEQDAIDVARRLGAELGAKLGEGAVEA